MHTIRSGPRKWPRIRGVIVGPCGWAATRSRVVRRTIGRREMPAVDGARHHWASARGGAAGRRPAHASGGKPPTVVSERDEDALGQLPTFDGPVDPAAVHLRVERSQQPGNVLSTEVGHRRLGHHQGLVLLERRPSSQWPPAHNPTSPTPSRPASVPARRSSGRRCRIHAEGHRVDERTVGARMTTAESGAV